MSILTKKISEIIMESVHIPEQKMDLKNQNQLMENQANMFKL
jgi:hypothetical protein